MIKGSVIKERDTILRPELNYRKLDALNASMIKLFDKDPVKFFEQFKLGKAREDESTVSIIIGDLVDFFLLDCKGDEDIFNDKFDDKFALFEGEKGSGQVFMLADILFKIRKSCINEGGNLTNTFENMFKEACLKVKELGKYNGKTEEKVLEDFEKNGQDYYDTLIENDGKTIVPVSLLNKAINIGKQLLEDDFTKELFKEDEEGDVESFPKYPIEWKYLMGKREISCKSELDLMRINHSTKDIYLYDLKTTYDNENFEYTYLKLKYYLQAAFYYLAVTYWAKENEMTDYKIHEIEYIVADTSANNRRPIRYKTISNDLLAGLLGFTLRGNTYRGVKELVSEIDWAEENNIWNCSKTTIDNNGVLELDLKYE